MTKVFIHSVALIVTVLALSGEAVRGAEPAVSSAPEEDVQVVCRIPIGEAGVKYEGQNREEALTWGPPAFTIAPDGSFWLADTVRNRLQHFTASCEPVGTIELAGSVVGVGDLEVTGTDIWLLDIAAQTPALLHLRLDGNEPERYDLPRNLRLGLSGLALADDGAVLVELEGGARLAQLVDAGGHFAPAASSGYPFRGTLYQTEAADPHRTPGRGRIYAGDRRIDINVASVLGGLSLLSIQPDGGLYAVVEEVAIDGMVEVDQTVRHYAADGEMLGMARVPLTQQYTYVAHGLAAGADGEMYALLTRPDHVAIARLNFGSELQPILAAKLVPSSALDLESLSAPDSCISRATIEANADLFLNNKMYLTSTNIDGLCAGRGKPQYLDEPGSYSSVSYAWGGFEDVKAFNNFMASGSQAGDVDTTANEPCSKGVDCSGFVSRAWGLTHKYSTRSLPDISFELKSTKDLLTGDILNKYDSHVILFDVVNPTGFYAWESTTSSYDRVKYGWSPWSRVSGYLPRRYSNLCGGKP